MKDHDNKTMPFLFTALVAAALVAILAAGIGLAALLRSPAAGDTAKLSYADLLLHRLQPAREFGSYVAGKIVGRVGEAQDSTGVGAASGPPACARTADQAC